MSTPSDSVGAHEVTTPLEGFTGPITPAKTGALYKVGLAIVACAMVLLPLLYIGLIALTAWAVVFHLQHDGWIFEGRGGWSQLVFYFGPAVAGGILVFFMIKPFFATSAKAPDRITLNPAQELMLVAFVERICRLVGAPAPCRIDVDCQVNASASLLRGLWHRDLALTIGLPLASGLDMRQFAGVLAHEFGHFAQGAGMRLTYIIRHINFWFARVVYERDVWDVKLENAARSVDFRIGIVLHAARGCVWLTRRILWGLMHAGNAISCFMLRQMEYDADSYEAKVAGSEAFESTARRLRVLNAATQVAYEDVRQNWASDRLPGNLPLLIDHKANSLPKDVCHSLMEAADKETTGWFDTHPSDSDRIAAARALHEPGVFHLTEPATLLFSEFGRLSEAVTRHHYEKNLDLRFTDKNLMSAEEIVAESAASAEADAVVRKFHGTVSVHLLPLVTPSMLQAPAEDDAVAKWRDARNAVESTRGHAEKTSARCLELRMQLANLASGLQLVKAGFRVNATELNLTGNPTALNEQETATESAIRQTRMDLLDAELELEPFMKALRDRVTLALHMMPVDGAVGGAAGAGSLDLARLLAAVGAEMPRAHTMASQLRAFTTLLQNRGNHSRPDQVDKVISELAVDLQKTVKKIQERLRPFSYPFPHAQGALGVADYLRSEEESKNPWQRAYQDAAAHVERLFALNYRLIGRVLAAAATAERERMEPNDPKA